MKERTTETQRSQCVGRVPRLEATGATRRNESLRGFLRKSYYYLTEIHEIIFAQSGEAIAEFLLINLVITQPRVKI